MTIKQIYDRFGTPPNLQEHMIRVAKVVFFLRNHWKLGNDQIDWDKAIVVALLHDLGNIVKFDLDKYPQMLGSETKRVGFWKQKQKEIIEKYGADDNEATKIMLEEINTSPDLMNIIFNKKFGYSVKTMKSDNWILKILHYADMVVLPDGVGTLKQRLDDVKVRMPKYANRIDFHDLVAACYEIENQVQAHLDIPVSQITNESVVTSFDFLATEV